MELKKINSRKIETLIIPLVSFMGLFYAVLGYLNENYFRWVGSFWLSAYSEKLVIIGFGIWRISKEKNKYTRNRLIVLVFFIATIWLLIPLLTGSNFLNHHVIGSAWFFIYLGIIFLVGRRADCSWNCPCVGIRDTAGHAFRSKTLKGDLFWNLRHIKWIFFASIILYLILIYAFPQTQFTYMYTGLFWIINLALYYASLILIPWTGNRNYCRYLCPWGSLYGAIGKLGFFKIVADREKCVNCRICEATCDMGVPIKTLIREKGEINTADCVGCGRCVSQCPRNALRMVDFRDYLPGFQEKIKKTS